MKLTLEVFNILLLLLPGLVASQVFYSTAGIEERKLPDRIIDSIIYSFIIYLLIGIIFEWKPLIYVRQSEGGIVYTLCNNRTLILSNLILMIIVPLIIAAFYHNDIYMKLLRKLKITTKSSRPNTWADVFISHDRYIVAHLKDGRRVRGYPSRFSTDPEEGFVYLFNPAWINDDHENEDETDYFETNAHGFLVNRSEIELIEFTLNPNESLDNKKGG